MNTLRIFFTDFWRGFDLEQNFFATILRKHFHLEISPSSPDILIYSNYGSDYLKFNCIRVLYTGENVRPDFNICDFSFSFDYGGSPQNYRLPLYALYDDVNKLTAPKDIRLILESKTKFCNFVYSNHQAKERIQFFEQLSKYRKVDSAGKIMNNLGRSIGNSTADKLQFIKPYKFTIAFENASYPGYTTEKIFQPMLVNSLPIYWGNPRVAEEFNDHSFVNVSRYSNFEEAIERIVEIDQNDQLYMKYLSEPYFPLSTIPENLKQENILNQFLFIASQIGKISPVSSTIRGRLRQQQELLRPYFKKSGRLFRRLFSFN